MTDRPKAALFRLLVVAAVGLGALAGFLTWQNLSRVQAHTAATQSVIAAREATTSMLSYKAGTVEADLRAARDRLTEGFADSYDTLINDVVIPGAKQKKISASAEIPAAASVSASPGHAVVLVFIDQTITVEGGAPTTTASSVRVTLDKIDGRWLVSGFDPV